MLDAIHELPPEEQLSSARAILAWSDTAEAASLTRALQQLSAMNAWLRGLPAVVPGGASAASLRGIAKMEAPPDDATVEQWLDEHRMEMSSAPPGNHGRQRMRG
jgi:hypothetical protein